MNTATYKVEVQTGEQEELPEMIAFDLDKGCWTSFTRDSFSSDLTSYAPSDLTFYAATIVTIMYWPPQMRATCMSCRGRVDQSDAGCQSGHGAVRHGL